MGNSGSAGQDEPQPVPSSVSRRRPCKARGCASFTELRFLQGHKDIVRFVAQLDEHSFVTGCDDGVIRVWDVHSGGCVRTLRGHTLGITALCVVHPHFILSGSLDCTIRLWHVVSGDCVVLRDHSHERRIKGFVCLGPLSFASFSARHVCCWKLDRKLADCTEDETHPLSGVRLHLSNTLVWKFEEDELYALCGLRQHRAVAAVASGSGNSSRSLLVVYHVKKTAAPPQLSLAPSSSTLSVSDVTAREHESRRAASVDSASVVQQVLVPVHRLRVTELRWLVPPETGPSMQHSRISRNQGKQSDTTTPRSAFSPRGSQSSRRPWADFAECLTRMVRRPRAGDMKQRWPLELHTSEPRVVLSASEDGVIAVWRERGGPAAGGELELMYCLNRHEVYTDPEDENELVYAVSDVCVIPTGTPYVKYVAVTVGTGFAVYDIADAFTTSYTELPPLAHRDVPNEDDDHLVLLCEKAHACVVAFIRFIELWDHTQKRPVYCLLTCGINSKLKLWRLPLQAKRRDHKTYVRASLSARLSAPGSRSPSSTNHRSLGVGGTTSPGVTSPVVGYHGFATPMSQTTTPRTMSLPTTPEFGPSSPLVADDVESSDATRSSMHHSSGKAPPLQLPVLHQAAQRLTVATDDAPTQGPRSSASTDSVPQHAESGLTTSSSSRLAAHNRSALHMDTVGFPHELQPRCSPSPWPCAQDPSVAQLRRQRLASSPLCMAVQYADAVQVARSVVQRRRHKTPFTLAQLGRVNGQQLLIGQLILAHSATVHGIAVLSHMGFVSVDASGVGVLWKDEQFTSQLRNTVHELP